MSAAGDAVERVQVALASPYRSGDGDPLILDLIADALAAVEAAGGGGGGEDSGWVDMSPLLINGWAVGNTGRCQYRKVGVAVYFDGNLSSDAAMSAEIAVMPEGFRPVGESGFGSDGDVYPVWKLNEDGLLRSSSAASTIWLNDVAYLVAP